MEVCLDTGDSSPRARFILEKREARSEKREARSEKREARSEKREARSEKRRERRVGDVRRVGIGGMEEFMGQSAALKKLGIIGGLGPAATASLFMRIIEHTDAATDQDHIDITILNRPQIPDRTAYILGKSDESYVPAVREAALAARSDGLRRAVHALRDRAL